MDEEFDHGPIVSQQMYKISKNDTYNTLEPKLAELGAKILIRDLSRYVSGDLKPKEQDHGSATFSQKITKEDGHIDWGQPASQIYNQWRAYIRWPGIYAYAKKNGARLRLNLKEVSLAEKEVTGGVGELVDIEGDLFVGCGQGAVEIKSIQPEGKNTMDAKGFINGYRDLLGNKLK